MNTALQPKANEQHLRPKQRREKADWAFSVRWALATCLGGTLSWILAYYLTFFSSVNPRGSVERAKQIDLSSMNPLSLGADLALMLCISFGLLVGIAQALVLHKRPGWTGKLSWGWIAASALGYMLTFLVASLVSFGLVLQSGSILGPLIAFVLASLLLSSVQWIALRRYVRGGDMWALANIAGTALAVAVAALTGYILNTTHIISIADFFFDWGYAIVSTIIVVVGLLIYGLVTGITLNIMERDTRAYAQANQSTQTPPQVPPQRL